MPQIYAVDLAGRDSAPLEWLAVLDDGEIRRANRFFRPSDRVAFVAAHALKRLALAQTFANRRANALQFAADSFGKPFLAEDAAPQFNLSHTTGLVALAVSRREPVGIDVEAIGAAAFRRDALQSVLTVAESAALECAADWERAFLALWTAKEAVIKAEGRGLSLPLSRIDVRQDSALGPTRDWALWRVQPTPSHVMALAWCGSDEVVDSYHLCADELTTWVRDEGANHRDCARIKRAGPDSSAPMAPVIVL